MSESAASVLDAEAILASFAGHQFLIAEIAKMVLAEYPLRLKEIENALAGGEASALEHAAHRLRGAVGQFHYQPLMQILRRMEKSGREKDLGAGEEDLEALRAECEIFSSALRDWLAEPVAGTPAERGVSR
jgi:HPt (histidine-containing phosphotransfer) domain-containing protein